VAAPGEHPYPEHYLAFCEKMAKEIGVDFVRRQAEGIRRDFPASAPKLIPKLREIYRRYK
jgi:hypothetical protein